jgi:DNA polymerase elongation subunit (family B)
VRILLLDIETAPNVAYVWGLFKQNIGIHALVDSGYVLCWAAKWLGEEEIKFGSAQGGDSYEMLMQIHALLSEADAVVHYNGARFDIPTLNKEFIRLGIEPPAPYKQIDLLRTVRKEFRFVSNKLDYVAEALGVRKKIKHAGFQLWIDCMQDKPEAWEQMKEYNIGDIHVLEDVYIKLLPWIKNHPNIGLYNDEGHVCPNCGGKHLERRGFSYTALGKFQRFFCKECGTWSRSKKSEANKELLQQDKN